MARKWQSESSVLSRQRLAERVQGSLKRSLALGPRKIHRPLHATRVSPTRPEYHSPPTTMDEIGIEIQKQVC
jgi:hypothetical protein